MCSYKYSRPLGIYDIILHNFPNRLKAEILTTTSSLKLK